MVEDTKPGKAPLIVAMKGHPGSGKSTLARRLASSLMIPLIDKDDIRDSTSAAEAALAESPAASRRLLNDMSYETMWRVASTQLRIGLGVVIDSPLSRQAHLDRIVAMAAEHRAGIFIVECRPTDEAEWRRWLEGRGGGGSWHKPSTWQDMEMLLEEYGGCTEYDVGDVLRVVVDTTEPGVQVEDVVSAVVGFIASSGGGGGAVHMGKSETKN